MREIQISYLLELEKKFARLCRQKQYARALKIVQQAMMMAQKVLAPQHPYHNVLHKNFRLTRQALLKNSKAQSSSARKKFLSFGCNTRPGTGEDLSNYQARAGQKNPQSLLQKGRQLLKNKGMLACGLLAALLLVTFFLIGFLSKLTVLNLAFTGASTLNAETVTEKKPVNPEEIVSGGLKDFEDLKEGYLTHSPVLQKEMLLEVPLILQNPELPRGCEVTSLAMLLQYAGAPVDKMTLAGEIKKDSTPYQIKDGKIYFGNPHSGFVGNMYTLNEPGYGVYHGPVCELLEKYLPGRTIDLTGCALEEVLLFISEGVPVWVVANATFAPLTPKEFQVWHTPQGSLKITYREHAVLLTGYDAENIYFNDPRFDIKNRRASRQEFAAAWKQMGSQAVSYLPY